MGMAPIFKKAYWSLAAMGAFYFVSLGLLTHPFIQRNAIYMHKLEITWRKDLTKPEEFGFAKDQVTPFFLPTRDGEKLFAWHVLPLGLYMEHRDELVAQESGLKANELQTPSLKLLLDDPDARLIIHFHGNAGTLGSSWRPFYLRSLSAAHPSKIHILAIDYRGYGLSSGTPSEEGLITDGLSAVDWAIKAGVSPDRIALVGQSLGTAVTFGVAERLATDPENPTEVGAVVSIAGFSDMRTLILTYTIAGFFPILSPLRPYPSLQKFFSNFVLETWNSTERVKSLVRASKNLKLIILHAYNDFEIPWAHSDALFRAAASATSDEEFHEPQGSIQIDKLKQRTDFGEESYRSSWPAELSKGNSIEQWVVKWGGHNQVVAGAGTSVIVAKALGL
ncbi:hypothetical protein RUND412_008195 [Rhizina undulata]